MLCGRRIAQRAGRVLAFAMSVASLGACSSAGPLAPDSAPAVDTLAAPTRFSEPELTLQAAALPAQGWWKVFGDPVLDTLVSEAMRRNPGLHQAAARVAQAAALQRAAGASLRPQVDLSAGASRQGGPLLNAAGASGNLFDATLHLGYEVDVLARASRSERAAAHDHEARRLQAAQVALLLQADIAQTYFAWRAARQEIALQRETTALRHEQHERARRDQRAGLAGELAVSKLHAQALAAEAEASALARRVAMHEHALAFLVGGELPLPTAPPPTVDEWRVAAPVVPAGIPARVLARRADVAATEQLVRAAELRLGIARDAWLPSLTLTAGGGVASSSLQELLRASSRAFAVSALLALPVFDGGRGEAVREGAAAGLALAAAEHREKVLGALRDVDDQLSALRTLADEERARDAAARGAAGQHERARGLARAGLASPAEVLQARREWLAEQRALAQVESSRLLATVGLVRALGGGWDARSAVGAGGAEGDPSGQGALGRQSASGAR
jgi:multidrug efflux system outer membrane protein